MKLSIINPATMKKFTEPNFCFSAYPLRVLKQNETDNKSFLHIHTSKHGLKKYVVNAKVFPMINPYPVNAAEQTKNRIANRQDPDSVQERDAEWFSSYE